MHSNVFEWVQDCWNGSYDEAPTDGEAWQEGECAVRVLRGGTRRVSVRAVRASHRLWNFTDYRDRTLGFGWCGHWTRIEWPGATR